MRKIWERPDLLLQLLLTYLIEYSEYMQVLVAHVD